MGLIKSVIEPYFRKKKLTLRELEARHLQMFYSEQLKKVKANTVIHYHAVIHSALKYAVKTDMLLQNVADKVDRPKKNDFQPVFLSAEEMQKMFEALRGTRLELPVLVAAFYGFRRGEVLGLKWDAIDFERGTISIKRTVTFTNADGTYREVEQQSAKTKSSLRTLPLVGSFRDYFMQVKEAQELNKKVCGNCYNYEYDGFVFVAGHLHEKNGYYYIILNLTDSAGKRKPKWISTGLTIKGNKKRAEQMLMEERRKYTSAKTGDDVLFADFMEQWLEIVKSTVSVPTYSSYVNAVKSIIAPYFRKRKILLRDLQAHDIQMFYQEQLQRVKPASVIHYHANIHKALKYAVKNDMIPTNPADKVERPKQDKFYGSFYDKEELNKLFEAVAGTKLELPVLLGAFYGLRRSEIIGLKWSAVDFEQNTITINHTVTSCNLDGKCVIVAKDTTKTKSSRRTLPLVPYFHEKLLAVKAQQEKNQKLCGRSYNKEFLEYICVDEIGDRFKPNYITTQFPKLLERNGFRKIRFHDLRHSCASLLLASGVPMKNIQEWLGHSDFSTTANIYAHLDYSSKLTSASAMESNFHLGV